MTVTNCIARPFDLIRCPYLGVVTRLELYDEAHVLNPPVGDPPPTAEVIAAIRRVNRLVAISLSGIPITDPFVAPTPPDGHEIPYPPKLTEMDFSHCQMTDDVVISLLDAGLFRRLKRIVLGGNPLTDQAAVELADRLAPVRTVEQLNLQRTNIGTAGQAALLAAFGSRVDLF